LFQTTQDLQRLEQKAHFAHVKGRFPFRLGTTSYILPAPIVPNIRFLGPYVDEVELVLFESQGEDNLPTQEEIQEMRHLAEELALSYNVHLPTDIFLGSPNLAERGKACATTLKFFRRTLPLEPTGYVLHLDIEDSCEMGSQVFNLWFERVAASLEAMIAEGLDPRRVAVENLGYPLEWIQSLVETKGMSICLDIGHLLRYGYDLKNNLKAFQPLTSMMHLHGVSDDVDHRGLELISTDDWAVIVEALGNYQGCLSVEVFSLENFRSSLLRLKELQF
jgi:sugar phosphate isomerase/epimerase